MGHSKLSLIDIGTHSAAITDTPPTQPAILDLYPIPHTPTEGCRLSWLGHTVGHQLAEGCLQLDQGGYQTRDLCGMNLPLEHCTDSADTVLHKFRLASLYVFIIVSSYYHIYSKY